jgi:sugar/nucleoside kinase (ribokinase family)
MRDFDILAVGDLCADLILSGDVTPAFGQAEKLVDTATLTIGGSTTIFACGAARLGLRVAFAGVAGDDEFGAFMRRALTARGVDMAGLTADPSLQTGISVHLARGFDRAILTYSGTVSRLRFDHLDLALIPRARHLHLGAYFLLDSLQADVPRLFDLAHAAGLTTSLDTNFDPSEQWNGVLWDVLTRTDVFLPNETEACAITGADDPLAALAILAQRVPTVALKRGSAGSSAQRGGESMHAPALLVDAVDTTGAGDSFDGGFLYGVLQDWSLQDCLRLANACGALSTRCRGGTDGQPTLAEAATYADLSSLG